MKIIKGPCLCVSEHTPTTTRLYYSLHSKETVNPMYVFNVLRSERIFIIPLEMKSTYMEVLASVNKVIDELETTSRYQGEVITLHREDYER